MTSKLTLAVTQLLHLLILGNEQGQSNNSEVPNLDFPTVAKLHLSKKIVPTPPPRVKKPSPPAAKVTTPKHPVAPGAVRKVVIIAKPKVPVAETQTKPVLQSEGYSGHFRSVLGNGRQDLNKDLKMPGPPPYASLRTIRNEIVPPKSALRTRFHGKCTTKHVWFNEIKFEKA